MKKIKPLFSLIIGLGILTISPVFPSYSSAETTEQTEDLPQFLKEHGDCFAWKFYLFTALYDLASQTASRELYDIKEKYFNNSVHSDFPSFNMYKVLPPEKAKKITNMIIEKEGGHCSKEVLYAIPRCTYDPNSKNLPPNIRGIGSHGVNTIYNVEVQHTMDFNYFSRAMGFPISKKLVEQYEQFLQMRVVEYPPSHNNSQSIWLLNPGKDYSKKKVFVFSYYNSFGACMIAKHHKYIKDHGMFDFKTVFYGTSTNPVAILNIPSLKIFSEESDKVTKKYKEKAN